MIVDERTYTLVPGSNKKYFEAYEREAMELQKSVLGNLIGYFQTEVGEVNQIVHLWGYESFEDRLRRREELRAHPVWKQFGVEGFPLVTRQQNRILIPTSFSPIR
jgi:hypothetical protein